VLTDVVERYTVRLAVERPRPPRPDGAPRPARACHAQEARTRRLKALFVRGDAVVAVAAVRGG
jgi:small nuclear ribonucleoprotein (snRNP)-like protein